MEKNEIKRAGLKVTLPRIKILELLENNSDSHPSAEDLYKMLIERGEDIGLATIYRVLTQFEAAGLVVKHNFEGGHSVFELDRGEHHDHLVCIVCGKVEEFCDHIIEAQQKEIAKEFGFSILDHSLTIYGRCSNPACNSGDK